MEFCELLGRFNRLDRLRLTSSAPTDMIYSRDGQHDVLTSLSQHCPRTLWHVTFNGEIYARQGPGCKWMTVEDLMEALEVERQEAEAKKSASLGAVESNLDEPTVGLSAEVPP